MTTYCEIREVADMADLRAWAAAHHVPIIRGGYTLSGCTIYSATCGTLTLVCVGLEKGPGPLIWRSPFE
ncbi:hypothetical protein CDO52_19585 [Nocardiopsis gilva YIM 90087]|uniref:Uncharacterized protein n=1 Tax=Nocardiopsis gilva YIM 90087 TaxID=1235441 RepID=A0A223S9E2_9ACTN|nr:hypothetical protein CDO52_19585 [Nocardiopsis gilva YIM 90087]